MVVFAGLLVASPPASNVGVSPDTSVDVSSDTSVDVPSDTSVAASVPPSIVVIHPDSSDDAALSTGDVTAVISASCGVVTTVIGLLTFRRAAQRDRIVNDRLAEMLKASPWYEPPGAHGQDI